MSRVELEIKKISKLPSCLLPVEVERNDEPAGAGAWSPRRRFWPADAAGRAGHVRCCLGRSRSSSAEGSASAAPSFGRSAMVCLPRYAPPAGQPLAGQPPVARRGLGRVGSWGAGGQSRNEREIPLAWSWLARIDGLAGLWALFLAPHGPSSLN